SPAGGRPDRRLAGRGIRSERRRLLPAHRLRVTRADRGSGRAHSRSPASVMRTLTLGRLTVDVVVERAGPTRPTWLLPDATPDAVEPHRAWLAPHFLDDKGRFLQSIHAFVVRAPGLTVLVDTCVGNDKDRGGRAPFHMMRTTFLDDLRAAGVAPESVDV